MRKRTAFTLVELLVVIGIIGVLIGILLPTLSRAREKAKQVQCQSNLRDIGAQLLIYAQRWNGWIIPPERGFEVPEDQRWPVYVFKPAVHNPAIMLCPSDQEPLGPHSYVLNRHLVEKRVKYGSKIRRGISPADVVVAGEKVSDRDDYYMNGPDYPTLIHLTRHGKQRGSNLLYLDLHVGNVVPQHEFPGKIDPWDVPGDG